MAVQEFLSAPQVIGQKRLLGQVDVRGVGLSFSLAAHLSFSFACLFCSLEMLALPLSGLFGQFPQRLLLALGARCADGLPEACCDSKHQGCGDGPNGSKSKFVSPDQFLKSVCVAGWPRNNRFVPEVTLNIRGEAVSGLVAARAFLLEALHNDPIEIVFDQMNEFWRVGVPVIGRGCQFTLNHRA